MKALNAAVLACSLAGCDRLLQSEPEPAPPAPASADTGTIEIDCDAPSPLVPRCPPESSPSCAAMWKKVEVWRAACGKEEGSEAAALSQPEAAPLGPIQSFTLRTRSGRLPTGISTVEVEGVLGAQDLRIDYRARLPEGGELRDLAWSGGLTGPERDAWIAVLREPPEVPPPMGRGAGERVLELRTEAAQRSLHVSECGALGELLLDLKRRARAE
jgi:hypothetical protein